MKLAELAPPAVVGGGSSPLGLGLTLLVTERWPPTGPRPGAPPPGSSRSRCTGTGCLRAPRGSQRPRPARAPPPSGGGPPAPRDFWLAGARAGLAGDPPAVPRARGGPAGARQPVPAQQIGGGDQQARRADPALPRARLDERLLHRVQHVAAGQALDRDYGPALRLAGRDQAGADRHVVEVYRAGTAFALLTGVLRAREPHPLAEHVEQALALPDVVRLPRLAVHRRRDPHCAQFPLAWNSVQAQVRLRLAMTASARRR